MQVMLVLLAVVCSAAWVAVDAAKHDWSENNFAKNVPSWVAGTLLLWPVVFPMYVFVHRKKAPLRAQPEAEAVPVPAVAMEAAPPSEQYGPSLDEVEVEVEPEPVVEIEPEPEPDPAPEPILEIEPESAPEPVVEIEPEPVVEIEPEPTPDPVIELQFHDGEDPVFDISRRAASADPEPEPEPEPEPAPEPEPEPALDPQAEIAEEAPPGLSIDAFKDIKPVAFGGFAGDDEPEQPEATQPEPEPQVVAEPEPAPESEGLAYPVDDEPVIEIEPEPVAQFEPEPLPEPLDEPIAAAVATEPTAEDPARKRGLRLPNPELKLPKLSLRRKPKASVVTTESDPAAAPAKKGFLTLPPQMQGPLDDLERKIALGSVVAVVAAAAFGYMSAPSGGEPAPAPAPAPAAASR